jgi:hypothetical protein
MYRSPWKPVYPNISKLPPNEVHGISCNVLRCDTSAIISATANHGITTLIVQHAIKQTADVIRKYNLTYADSERIVKWICERSFSEFVNSPTAPNVGSGAEEVRGGVEDSKQVPPCAGEVATPRSGTEEKGGDGDGRGRGGRSGPVIGSVTDGSAEGTESGQGKTKRGKKS